MATRHAAIAFLALALFLLPSWPVGFTSADLPDGDGYEDFEDFAVLAEPDAEWYTYATVGSGGSGFVTDSWSVSPGGRSLHFSSNGATPSAEARFTTPDFEYCANSAEGYEFWLNVTSLPDTNYVAIGLTDGGSPSNEGYWLRISNTGAATARAIGSLGDDSQSLGLTVVENTPYHFRFLSFNCNSASFTLQELTTQVSVTANAGGNTNEPDKFMIEGAGNSHTVLLDDLDLSHAAPPPPGPTAEPVGFASPQPDGIIGWDIAADGSLLITRESNALNVTTYGGSSLNQFGRVATPSCNRFEGVNALGGDNIYATYIDCDADDGDDVIRIRGSDLGTPVVPCTDGSDDSCDTDLTILTDPQDGVFLRQVTGFRVNYESRDTNNLNEAALGFAFSTQAGRIGVWVSKQVDNGAGNDVESVQQVDFALGGIITDICSWRDTADGKNYLAAASPDASTKFWEVRITPRYDQGGVLSPTPPDVSLVNGRSLASAYDGALGISCAGNLIAVATESGRVAVVDKDTNTPVFDTITGVDTVERGVTLSTDGKFVAYYDETEDLVHIIEVATGNETGTLAYTPDGTMRGIKMDSTAQNLWAVSSNNVTRFLIFELTTEEPVGVPENPPFQTEDPTDGDTQTSGAVGVILPPADPGTEALRGAIMLVAGMALAGGGTAAVAKENEMKIDLKVILAVAGFGGLIACVVGYKLGLVTDWFLGVTVLAFVGTVVAVVASRFSGGDR